MKRIVSACILGACLIGAPLPLASAQDPYTVQTPVDVVIMTDWSQIWYSDGVGSAANGPSKQSTAQITRNKKRMSPRPSPSTRRQVDSIFVAPLRALAPELGTVAHALASKNGESSNYKAQMKSAGFNSNDLSDVITAYTLSTYMLAHTGRADISSVPAKEKAAAARAVRSTLVTYLPASLSDTDLRALLELTRLEHALQLELLELSANDASDDRAYVRQVLIERAEDYALVDVELSRLHPVKGFVER